MAYPYRFSNVSELDTPQLDADFDAIGALATIPCTASGTNTITLTPAANTPSVLAYTNNAPVFGFAAAATTTTSPVTINVSGLGARNVYKNNGTTLIGTNDFLLNNIYYVAFNSALNGGVGGFVVLNPGSTSATAGAVQGSFQQLSVTNTTTGNPRKATVITATSLSVSDGALNFTTLLAVNTTCSIASSGAGGLDTGSVAPSTWYALYVIYNPATLTTSSCYSLSFTAPTLPSGYTQYARVGAALTDSSSNLNQFFQNGRDQEYVVNLSSFTPTVAPNIAHGAVGTYSGANPVLVSQSISGVVPPTAAAIMLLVSNSYKNGTGANILVAPDTNWGGTNNGPTGSNGNVFPAWITGGGSGNQTVKIVLAGLAVAWCSDAAGGAISCLGYTDNL